MSQTIRNFEQLILVKHLYQDARDTAEQSSRLAQTKAIILLDLSIEQTLKNILLNLNPNYIIQKGRNDIQWRELWREASKAVQDIKGVALSEQMESTRLHELRNLVQHNGTVPPTPEVQRYVVSTKQMLTDAFRDAFDLDFDNLRPWDFIGNADLRRLLNDSEEYLGSGQPVFCIIGCKLARRLIMDALRRHIQNPYDFPPVLRLRSYDESHALREFIQYVEELDEYTSKVISRLETELIFVGLGLSIIDTRRFIQAAGPTDESIAVDGQMHVNLHADEVNRAEVNELASFMLDYLYRLVRRIDEDRPDVLDGIEIKVPLSEQGIALHPEWIIYI